MTRSNFIRELKGLIYEFTDNGAILDQPKSQRYRQKLSERRKKFIREFIHLLLNSNMLSDYTKYYISNKYVTYAGTAQHFNKKGEKKKVNTLQTQVYRDIKKIKRIFNDERIFAKIFEYSNYDITEYEKKLRQAFVHYSDDCFNNIALNLTDEVKVVDDISEEELEEFIKEILPYHICHMVQIEENINKRILSYVRGILAVPKELLNEIDIRRREMLLQLLGD